MFLPEMGKDIDIIFYADDFGIQNGMLMSLAMFRKYFKPRYKEIFSFIKSRCSAYIFFRVYDLIPDLIELGVDIFDPVQVNATKMDTKRLKKEFGDSITFWGGGIDTQKILPFGKPQEVKDEVRRRIEDITPGGGFISNTMHNIQANVPPEKINGDVGNSARFWQVLVLCP